MRKFKWNWVFPRTILFVVFYFLKRKSWLKYYPDLKNQTITFTKPYDIEVLFLSLHMGFSNQLAISAYKKSKTFWKIFWAIQSQYTVFGFSSNLINLHLLVLFCECLNYWLWYATSSNCCFPQTLPSQRFSLLA